MNRSFSRLAALALCVASIAACTPSPQGSTPSPSAPPPSTTPAASPSAVASVTETQVKSMTYLGTCGWDFPGSLVTMKDGKQTSAPPEWDVVSSSGTITKTTPVTLNGVNLMVVSFTCTVGRDPLYGEHLVGLVDGKPQDLGAIAISPAPITVQAGTDELTVSYTYQKLGDSNAVYTGKTSYRVGLVGNTPIRLYDKQTLDQVDPAVAQLKPLQWAQGLVGINGTYDGTDSYWMTGLLMDPEHVITNFVLGAFNADCLGTVVYTQTNEEIPHQSINLMGSNRQNLFGTVVKLQKPSTAAVATYQTGAVPTNKQAGLVVEISGRVPALATAETTKTEAVWVTSAAPEDEQHVLSRTTNDAEDPGPYGFFLDWDGTVLWQGLWWNQSRNAATDLTSGAMSAIPKPETRIQEDVCIRRN